MSLERAVRGGMMSRAIRESLGSFTTPERTDEVLRAALSSGGLTAIPETAHEAAAFVNGPLRRAITRLVGEDAAEAVVEGLRPVVEVASGFHSVPDGAPRPTTSRAPAATAGAADDELDLELELPADRGPAGTPVVLFASLDRPGADAVARQLSGQVEVRLVSDTFEWLASLETFAGRRLWVVVDCCLPSIDPASAGHFASMLPAHTDVVLWGAGAELLEALFAQVGNARNWHALPADTTPARLADFLRAEV